MTRTQRATAQFTAYSKKEVVSTFIEWSSFWKSPNVMMMRGTQICAIMCDVKRDEDEIYTFGRNVYSWTSNRRSNWERNVAVLSLPLTFLIIKARWDYWDFTDVSGPPKEITNDLLWKISLERDQIKETISLLPLRPLSFSVLGFPRRTRDRRQEEEHHHHQQQSDRISFFSFFFSPTAQRFWLNFSLSQ